MAFAEDRGRQFDGPPNSDDPHSIEIEQALLGAILIRNEAYYRVASFLKPEFFFDPLHRQIFELCGSMIKAGNLVDAKTVKTALPSITMMVKDGGKIGEMSLAEYVAVLAREAVTIVNSEDYGHIIHDLSVRRGILAVVEDARLAARSAAPDMPVGKLLEEIEGGFAELRSGHQIAGVDLSAGADLQKALDFAAKAAMQNEPAGWPWFIPEAEITIDARCEPGNVVGLLGASGDGKTSFTLQQMLFLAEQGIPCLFLSGEQSNVQCLWQMHTQALSRRAVPEGFTWNYSAKDIRDGKIPQDAFDIMVEHSRHLARLPMAIQKWSDSKIGDLGVRVRQFVRKYGPAWVAIDHFKKIVPNNKKDIFAQQVFQVGEGLKDLATETGCFIQILMHRNSAFLDRRIMRPIRADVFGQENGLQNLDQCLAIFRPDIWLKERHNMEEKQSQREQIMLQIMGEPSKGISGKQGKAEFYALKTRFGEAMREQVLWFRARYTRFESMGQHGLQAEPSLI